MESKKRLELDYKKNDEGNRLNKSEFKTPILFLIFNQPKITMESFKQIIKIKPKNLYIAADGPRKDNLTDLKDCFQVREQIIKKINWECDLKTRFQDENLGAKNAVSSSITWFLDDCQEGIILEYDCVASESFFYFCSEMLEKYRLNKKVMSISGSNHVEKNITNDPYFFSQIPSVWGWATWNDAWKKWDPECNNYKKILTKIFFLFDSKKYSYFWIKKLKKIKLKMDKTWGHPLVFSFFLNDGLSVTPQKNLVTNIGFSKNATNAKDIKNIHSNMKRFEYEGNKINKEISIIRNTNYDNLYTHSLALSEPKSFKEELISFLLLNFPLAFIKIIKKIYRLLMK